MTVLSTSWSFHSVVATGSPGDLLHTNPSSSRHEEVRLDAWNNSSAPVTLTIEWSGVSSADRISISLPVGSGPLAVIPDWRLAAGESVRAYAGTTAVVGIYFVVSEAE